MNIQYHEWLRVLDFEEHFPPHFRHALADHPPRAVLVFLTPSQLDLGECATPRHRFAHGLPRRFRPFRADFLFCLSFQDHWMPRKKACDAFRRVETEARGDLAFRFGTENWQEMVSCGQAC